MQTKLTTAVAILLLAGTSGAAMAQDRDHGERGQSTPQAQPQHAGPPGGGHPGGPGGPPHAEGGPRGPGPVEHMDHSGPPAGGFHERVGPDHGPQGPVGAPPQHFSHDGGPGPGAPQRFSHDGGPGPGAPRQFDHDRGPGGPPGAQAGRGPGPGWRGGDGPPLFGGTHGAPPHWQAGRFPPVMFAHDRFRAGYYRTPYGYYSRAWVFGDFLPRPWFARDYWLDDFLDFDLPYPPPGFVWVRVGPDALMIDRFTGRVVQVVRDIFW
ncbi:MAG: RcnB family protein [Phenylobacterium sp.]